MKLLAKRVTDPLARDARTCGLDIDWSEVPEMLDDVARAAELGPAGRRERSVGGR